MSDNRTTSETVTIHHGDGPFLSGLYVYPIKSMGGIPLGTSEVGERGLRRDRRWMLVDKGDVFISQRELPRMALIGAEIGLDALIVVAPGMPSLHVPFDLPDGKLIRARIWDDVVQALPVGDDADRWFGEFLGVRCRLVHLPDGSVRPVDPHYGRAGDQVGLADGFPFLLISEASLADLNSRLEEPLPMNRFRPSLVVGGCEPFAEDGWSQVRIGQLTFRVVTPCARCAITTVDQKTAATGKEPLRTLARYRKVESEVFFGQNLAHDATGTLRTGDPVEILRAR